MSILLGMTLTAHARSFNVKVINVPAANTLEVSDSTRRISVVRLAAITLPDSARALQRAAVKRLQTLALGKSIQLQLTAEKTVIAGYGGLQLNSRLLNEGLAVIEPQALNRLPQNIQQQFSMAQQQARQNRIGIWAAGHSSDIIKFHEPWSANQIPAPMTRAPVYQPAGR